MNEEQLTPRLIEEILNCALSKDEFAHEQAETNVRSELDDESLEIVDLPTIQEVSTFKDAGILTDDNGLVVSMSDGTEYQVTIKRSR